MRIANKRTIEEKVDGVRVVYVGRPTQYGNPFVIGRLDPFVPEGVVRKMRRPDVIHAFRFYAVSRLVREPDWLDPLLEAEVLVCWCWPDECHANVLADLIEKRRRELAAAA